MSVVGVFLRDQKEDRLETVFGGFTVLGSTSVSFPFPFASELPKLRNEVVPRERPLERLRALADAPSAVDVISPDDTARNFMALFGLRRVPLLAGGMGVVNASVLVSEEEDGTRGTSGGRLTPRAA